MKNLLLIVFCLLLASCGDEFDYSTKHSPVRIEQGVVVAKGYQPETTTSGGGMGMSLDGDISFVGTSHTSKEKWAVVFRCQHNVLFTVDNSTIYERLSEGDSVYIKYKEIWRVNNVDTVKYKSRFVDFEFVDAHKQ